MEPPVPPSLDGTFQKLKSTKGKLSLSSWNKRFFKIDTLAKELVYYPSIKTTRASGAFPLADIKEIRQFDDFQFQIETGNRNLFLKATEAHQVRLWVTEIQRYCRQLKQYNDAKKQAKMQAMIDGGQSNSALRRRNRAKKSSESGDMSARPPYNARTTRPAPRSAVTSSYRPRAPIPRRPSTDTQLSEPPSPALGPGLNPSADNSRRTSNSSISSPDSRLDHLVHKEVAVISQSPSPVGKSAQSSFSGSVEQVPLNFSQGQNVSPSKTAKVKVLSRPAPQQNTTNKIKTEEPKEEFDEFADESRDIVKEEKCQLKMVSDHIQTLELDSSSDEEEIERQRQYQEEEMRRRSRTPTALSEATRHRKPDVVMGEANQPEYEDRPGVLLSASPPKQQHRNNNQMSKIEVQNQVSSKYEEKPIHGNGGEQWVDDDWDSSEEDDEIVRMAVANNLPMQPPSASMETTNAMRPSLESKFSHNTNSHSYSSSILEPPSQPQSAFRPPSSNVESKTSFQFGSGESKFDRTSGFQENNVVQDENWLDDDWDD